MDEYEEIKLVMTALATLRMTEGGWSSNHRMFAYKYNDKERIIWWRRAKLQAQAGAPAMQQLLLKVIELRLTR